LAHRVIRGTATFLAAIGGKRTCRTSLGEPKS
jgi:hypothetical protein